MNISEATKTIQLILFDRYGTFLTLKEVGVIRKTEGKKWGGKVYLESKVLSEPIFIGIIEIDEDKKLTGIFTKHEIISKIVEVHNQPQDYEEDPFADLFSEEEEKEEMDPGEIREELDELVKKADEESLQKSRSLYPLLLNHTDNKGPILHEMGLLEIALKNNDLALEYLEAAAIEYANVAQVELIFKIADRVESLI
ncbi:MAG: hypothetical protein PF689_10250 [Deltaproteobacteria bacterium]|jgi:hypothetical protein|nr:hypothetical protein [Deltaproteobacteria bacterium]